MIHVQVTDLPAADRKRPAWAVVTLGVGVLLYFLPVPLLPFLMAPIAAALRAIGLLSAGAGTFERGFAAAMVIRWLAVVLLLLYIPFVEREPLSSIGLKLPRPSDLLLAVATAAVTIVVGGGLFLLVHGPGPDAGTQHAQIAAVLGVAGRIQVSANAAVLEELLFRAVLIERLLWLTGNRWVAGGTSVVLFAASHYLSGSEALLYSVIVDGVAGTAFACLYLLRRNVVANMVAHFLADFVGLVLL
jgi:membrane protease YdiL (CAAX protease family)